MAILPRFNAWKSNREIWGESMELEMAKVKVARRKSGSDKVTYTQYEVVFDKHKSVLRVLKEIFAEQDRTLGFRRYSCNRGVCGSCTMIINGEVKRACVTSMSKEMTIEPFEKYGVIKDLVTLMNK